MLLRIQRIEIRVMSMGVYNANSYNIKYKGAGRPRIATKNPRFEILKKLGAKVKATWKKEVDEIR